MGKIINTQDDSRHTIKKFSFNKLETDDEEYIFENFSPFTAATQNDEEIENKKENDESDEEIKKELLEKIEQLTSDVIRVQMELEKKENEFEQKLLQKEKESYEKGKEEAIKSIYEETEQEMESLKSQLIRSIEILDEQKQKFDQTLDTLEKELLESTFILAKKVIAKEIETNSAKIATNIAKELIKTIKESSNITLKVNPADKEFISSQIKASMIKIEADEAIQKGGVVILSDGGNIDADILTRFKQTLRLLQKES